MLSLRNKESNRNIHRKNDNNPINENDIILKNIKDNLNSNSKNKGNNNIISENKENKTNKILEDFNTFVIKLFLRILNNL